MLVNNITKWPTLLENLHEICEMSLTLVNSLLPRTNEGFRIQSKGSFSISDSPMPPYLLNYPRLWSVLTLNLEASLVIGCAVCCPFEHDGTHMWRQWAPGTSRLDCAEGGQPSMKRLYIQVWIKTSGNIWLQAI